jgi:hypothetical protein
MSDVEDFAAAQEAEYATYVATEPILVDGARAYNAGDPVPASNVKTHGYLQLGVVRKADDPAPDLTAPEPPPAPQGDPVVIGDITTTKKKG